PSPEGREYRRLSARGALHLAVMERERADSTVSRGSSASADRRDGAQRLLHAGIGHTGFATAASGGNTILGWRSRICATIALASTLSCFSSNFTPCTSRTCSAFRSVVTSAFWMAGDSADRARLIASAITWTIVMYRTELSLMSRPLRRLNSSLMAL